MIGPKTNVAILWLQSYLKNGPKHSGPIHPTEPDTVIGDAALKGIRYATLRRASDELGVQKTRKIGSKCWFWSLPLDETGLEAEQ